jgi:hypothetical protein
MQLLSRRVLTLLLLLYTSGVCAEEQYRHDTTFGINGILAPFSVPYPLGYGVSAHYVSNPNWILEAEYFRSSYAFRFFSFELGEIIEQKVALQARYFPSRSGSLNFIMGFGYRNLEARLPRDWFDLVTNNYSETAAEFSTRFIKLGFANQWQWRKKYLVTVDWLVLEIPVSPDVRVSASQYADDPEDKEDIEGAETVLKWYPSGAIVKFNIGFVF